MSVASGKRRNGFTKVPNNIWEDEALCPEDVGVLAYLASHAKHWVFRREKMRSDLKMGEGKLDRIRKKLFRLGYLKRTPIRRNGKVDGVRYTVNWSPVVQSLNLENQGSEIESEPLKTAR